MSEYTFTKSTCEQYTIRLSKMGGWAKIILDQSTGLVSISSDFGSWSYHWCNHGQKSLKHFLTRCDRYYLSEKFVGRKNYFDIEKTIKHLKERIRERRKDGSLTIDHAGHAYEVIRRAEEYCGNSSDLLQNHLVCDQITSRLFNPTYEYMYYDYDPSVIQFFDKIWPIFIEKIKREIVDLVENKA